MKTAFEYFAYGSNMLTERITDRLGPVEKTGLGILRNHQLVFNRLGTYLPGGVASVVPRLGSDVLGVIWKIDAVQLKTLDIIEDPEAYSRETVGVDLEHNNSVECLTYISLAQGYHPPSEEYLSYLIQGAEEHGFPARYVRNLKRRITRKRLAA